MADKRHLFNRIMLALDENSVNNTVLDWIKKET